MNNKTTYVTSSFIGDKKKIVENIYDCLESGMLTNEGSHLKQLEQELKEYLDVENISLFCNGTIALMIALRGLDLTGEVITTPFTFPATAHSLEWLGLTPVFCDIDPDTMCIDPEKIESLITDKTSAILGVHVYGMPCDVFKIDEIATKHKLKVIYDGAHSFLTRVNNKSIGLYGDVSMFSFHATKLFNTIEGGALIYNDKNLTEKFYLLKNFGIKSPEEVVLSGINGKMNEIQAIVGLENLHSLETEIQKRKELFDFYNSELSDIDGIKLINYPANTTPSFQYYPIRVEQNIANTSRDKIFEELKLQNIIARKYFYPLCSNYPCYSNIPSAKKEFLPIANKVSEEILCLPFYGVLEKPIAKNICDIIKSCL
jgi:dTDP-4-amino-4,6-dideoxygalactose transaminase